MRDTGALTLFTIPKPFRDNIALIQRNAIRSWTLLRPTCEILLFGDDEGTAETAAEFGLRHIPNVARSEYGTPLVSDLFEQAQRLATHHLFCYVNADIILMSDFMAAVRRIPFRRFLMAGRRWDVDLEQALDFQAGWENRLREYTLRLGKLHPPVGIDYFVFTRGLWEEIPPFAIGRTAWDNWLLYEARARGAPLIDATRAVMAIHQNHDYTHVPGGFEEAWKGPEAQRNRALMGGFDHLYTLTDATWFVTRHLLLPAMTSEYRHWHSNRFADSGFRAYREGNLRQAARYLVKAVCYRPSLLANRGVLSILAESVVGRRLMARYREWRHRTDPP